MGAGAQRGRKDRRTLYVEERPAIARLLAEWPPERIQALMHDALWRWGAQQWREEFRWRWNARLRTTAGRAVLDDDTVELNPLLLARHPEEMGPVLVHELAHLVVAKRHGWRAPAHGAAWKRLMRLAGVSASATHEMPVKDLQIRRRRYRRWR